MADPRFYDWLYADRPYHNIDQIMRKLERDFLNPLMRQLTTRLLTEGEVPMGETEVEKAKREVENAKSSVRYWSEVCKTRMNALKNDEALLAKHKLNLDKAEARLKEAEKKANPRLLTGEDVRNAQRKSMGYPEYLWKNCRPEVKRSWDAAAQAANDAARDHFFKKASDVLVRCGFSPDGTVMTLLRDAFYGKIVVEPKQPEVAFGLDISKPGCDVSAVYLVSPGGRAGRAGRYEGDNIVWELKPGAVAKINL